MTAEIAYKNAVAAQRDAETRLGAIPKGDPARNAVKLEIEAAVAALQVAKQALKDDNARRNFAGLGNSPFYVVCAERLDPALLAELSEKALAVQVEREETAAARRAKKEATPQAPQEPIPVMATPPKGMRSEQRASVEVVARRPMAGR